MGEKFFILLFLLLTSSFLSAWPTTSQWIPILKDGAYLQDDNTDTQGSRNVVSGPGYSAAFMYNDGTYIYFRLRLDNDPSGTGGQGFLEPYGWGVLIDTNLNYADYEWMFMVDGISKTEVIDLWHNTVQGTPGSPSDSAEILAYSIPVNGNYQVIPADTSFNGDADYFLDWRFPYDVFKQYTGLTDTSPMRMFFGTSNSSNSLSADLVGASDLYSGFSDYVTPYGAKPTTGTVRFVADAAGNGDVTEQCIGNTIYVRVDDGDQNYNSTAVNVVEITLSVPNGDTETLTLLETGANTGVFTGYIALTYGDAVPEDGTFRAAVGSTVTATYIDAIDASILLNQPRTDTLVVCGPVITLTKTVVPSVSPAGGTITYTIKIDNTAGTDDAHITEIHDTLPTGFSYISGTTSGLTSDNPDVNGEILVWNGNWTVPEGGFAELTFQSYAGSTSGIFYNNSAVYGMNFTAFYTGDTAPVSIGAPQITLSKTADKGSAAPGEEIIYTTHYHNAGDGETHNLIIMDNIPFNTTYVAGSLRAGGAGSTYTDAAVLTDAEDADAGYIIGSTVFFNIGMVGADDGSQNAGTDEGKIYFKVTVD